jgi:hypothetical protein
VTIIISLLDLKKKYGDTWNWYDSEKNGLPNYKMRCKQVPCSRETINAIKDYQKLDPLPSIPTPTQIDEYLFFI